MDGSASGSTGFARRGISSSRPSRRSGARPGRFAASSSGTCPASTHTPSRSCARTSSRPTGWRPMRSERMRLGRRSDGSPSPTVSCGPATGLPYSRVCKTTRRRGLPRSPSSCRKHPLTPPWTRASERLALRRSAAAAGRGRLASSADATPRRTRARAGCTPAAQ